MPGYIHHIQWCVTDKEKSMKTMMEGYQFRVVAMRDGQNQEVVLQSGDVAFLISQRTASTQPDSGDGYPWLRCSCRTQTCHEIDSVFNMCLEVGDVDKTFSNMVSNGSEVLHPPTTITTPDGFIRYAVVTSPCDNVIHSLVNTQSYHGVFLPGFSAPVMESRELTTNPSLFTQIDHVALVTSERDSGRILEWYRKCCGMERFLISKDEDPDDGTVFEDVGMRLSAGDWMSEWLCREQGVMWQDAEDQRRRNFKLVIAEPLENREDSHVHSFLHEHGGPGLQHIGLLTNDITETMKILSTGGAAFRKPPPTYYTLEGKKEEMEAAGTDPKTIQELGILIDLEYKEPKSKFEIFEEDEEEDNYLLQIFSFPVFGQNTFFLEIIQRQGASGFGGGNIRALAQSIVELQKQQQERVTQTRRKLTRAPSRPILKTSSHNEFESMYSFKQMGLNNRNRTETKHTFDLETTDMFSSFQRLQMKAERMTNMIKRNSSMTVCMMDDEQRQCHGHGFDDYTCVK